MKAHELLDSPEKWTQGARAKDEHDAHVEARSPVATKWCCLGAIEKVSRSKKRFEAARLKLLAVLGAWEFVSVFNDDPARTFEEVRAALLKADV